MTHPHPHARLFVALELPREVRTQLAGWARTARAAGELRVLDEEVLHVTLCFLGARPVGEIATLADVVTQSAQPLGELTLHAPLWLPPRRPRALAVEVHEGTGALEELHAGLVRAIAAAIDWEPERRRLRAHVTVARLRAANGPHERTLPPTPALAFAAESLTLYRSHLAPTGASYEPLQRASLG